MEIILAEGSATLSRLIQKLTRSNKSHCAIRYSGADSNWLVHAHAGGVSPDWYFYFKKKYVSISRYRVLFSVGEKALDNVVANLAHAPYDFLGLFGSGVQIIFGLKKNPFSSNRAYKCTELVVAWIEECKKLDPTLDLLSFDCEVVTPKALEEYLLSEPRYFQAVIERVDL